MNRIRQIAVSLILALLIVANLPLSAFASIPGDNADAKKFFANTNLEIYDWTTLCVDIGSHPNIKVGGTAYFAKNGDILGYIKNGEVSFSGTGYSYDTQGGIDAFNDYRGVSRVNQQNRDFGTHTFVYNENAGTPSSSSHQGNSNKVDIATLANEVVFLINNERIAAGLDELVANSDMMAAAMVRAQEISESYGHSRPNGSIGGTWAGEITGSGMGSENIGRGYNSASAIVKAWMESSGHKNNILNSASVYTGVGCYQDENGKLYWVQMFAR